MIKNEHINSEMTQQVCCEALSFDCLDKCLTPQTTAKLRAEEQQNTAVWAWPEHHSELYNSCCVIVHLIQNTFLREKTIRFSKKNEIVSEGDREREKKKQ